MARKYGNYQYETSPRKIQPEYIPKKKKTTNNKKNKNYNKKVNNDKKSVQANKIEKKVKVKVVLLVAFLFSILLVISYRNSQITEKFTEVRNLKNDLAAIEKENEQLQVSIESSINLSTIEKEAQEQLGMKRLDNNQKIYVSLPKKDYVESATEEIIEKDEQNWFQKLMSSIFK